MTDFVGIRINASQFMVACCPAVPTVGVFVDVIPLLRRHRSLC
jgi:hypothetical protein